MGRCIVLVGGMASGKTTLLKELENRGFRRIVTYTTRPKRPGEIDGIDYHFISDEDFHNKVNEGFFAESTSYNADFGFCLYGSALSDYYSKDNTVIILNPQGIINLGENETDVMNTFIVYLNLRECVLRERALERGDSLKEIDRRINDDKFYFKEWLSLLHTRKPNLTFEASSKVEWMADVITDALALDIDYIRRWQLKPEDVTIKMFNPEDESIVRLTTKRISELYPIEASYRNKSSLYHTALMDNIITEKQYDLAKEYYGKLWNYFRD